MWSYLLMKCGQLSCTEFYFCYQQKCLSIDLFQKYLFAYGTHKENFRTWFFQITLINANYRKHYQKQAETYSSCMAIQSNSYQILITLLHGYGTLRNIDFLFYGVKSAQIMSFAGIYFPVFDWIRENMKHEKPPYLDIFRAVSNMGLLIQISKFQAPSTWIVFGFVISFKSLFFGGR